ncbi:MAG TPA: bifunctional nuclease family protein [Bacteroidales bacterium]|nr:bifunctional nuclease family protein [Bacteroidales bacterium]HQI69731.1 bifunctional nuclease family protein [Bacteroidales bacterium]
MEKIRLDVVGITKSQTQSGAFAVILEDTIGKRRLPILIGYSEAQSIAIALENIKPPRPLTHDLFKSFCDSFNVKIIEVIISKLSEGVFYSKLICHDGIRQVEIDSRTSDAIALALRFDCRIFAYKSVMEAAHNIEGDEDEKEREEKDTPRTDNKSDEELPDEDRATEFEKYSLNELNEMMKEAIANEDYERASRIRDEINKRK